MELQFTDLFFKFPVLIYDDKQEQKNVMLGNEESPVDQIMGMAKVNHTEIMLYREALSDGYTFEEARDEGFKETILMMQNGASFLVPWTMKKLEDRLNAHIKIVEEFNQTKEQSKIQELEAKLEELQKKYSE